MRTNVKRVLEELGENYSMASVDYPPTEDVYRDFHNGIDVEILVPYYRRNLEVSVFIWKDKREIIERAFDVPLNQLKGTLEQMYRQLGLATA